jgi:hypothetical protein
MSDNTKNWLYVLAVIVGPLLLVHLTHSGTARLISVIWVLTAVPSLFVSFAFNPRAKILSDTSRLNKTADPERLRKWTILLRSISFVAAIAWFLYFTFPVLLGAYNVYIRQEPFSFVHGTVSNVQSGLFAPGLFWNIHLIEDPTTGYAYWFPTTYNFGNTQSTLIVLPGTNFVLTVEQE